MDAIVMLREDHRKVERMFKSFERGDATVVADICSALEQHATLEEQVFYPAVKKAVEHARGTILESLEEHHVVETLISEIQAMSGREENFAAKVTVLIENVRHHIREEEDELFPEVRSALGRRRLQELADEMESRRQPA